MRSLRPEFILLLLFLVVVPLFNALVRWLQRAAREQQRPAPAEPMAAEPVAREEWLPASPPPHARVIEEAIPRGRPTEAPPAPRPQPLIRQVRLLGGRAAVRRTIVAMTILGPCRALEERTPTTPANPRPR